MTKPIVFAALATVLGSAPISNRLGSLTTTQEESSTREEAESTELDDDAELQAWMFGDWTMKES